MQARPTDVAHYVEALNEESCTFAGMAAVILGGVMAAQPLTGKSLAQHTYMFAGEVLRDTALQEQKLQRFE
jgi:hypothetical protein